MYFDIDPRFKSHFRNLKQVFLYITDECNLRCEQCLYKPNLVFHMGNKEIPQETAEALVSDFQEMGASKLSILGGEPTLYGTDQDHESLKAVISRAQNVGYEYVRLDTNGQFGENLFDKSVFEELNEISFSLDGFSPETNDLMRGEGAFVKCVSNIKRAVKLGYKTDITCCVHRALVQRDEHGNLLIESMIDFAESLGVNRLNFHVLFKPGFPMDTWTGQTDVSWQEWTKVYPEIYANIQNGRYKIPVRIPQRLVKRKEFERNPKYYGFCPAKLGERILVHPNGIIRICSGMLSTPYGVAKFYGNKIVWDESPTNELCDHDLDALTPCTNQNKSESFGDFVPLCFSFKPRQKELIWQEKLEWETTRAK